MDQAERMITNLVIMDPQSSNDNIGIGSSSAESIR